VKPNQNCLPADRSDRWFFTSKILTCLSSESEDAASITAGYGTKRNILGRNGWLNNLHLALTMNDEVIYLSHAWSQENL
jgi:hypothetical protein